MQRGVGVAPEPKKQEVLGAPLAVCGTAPPLSGFRGTSSGGTGSRSCSAPSTRSRRAGAAEEPLREGSGQLPGSPLNSLLQRGVASWQPSDSALKESLDALQQHMLRFAQRGPEELASASALVPHRDWRDREALASASQQQQRAAENWEEATPRHSPSRELDVTPRLFASITPVGSMMGTSMPTPPDSPDLEALRREQRRRLSALEEAERLVSELRGMPFSPASAASNARGPQDYAAGPLGDRGIPPGSMPWSSGRSQSPFGTAQLLAQALNVCPESLPSPARSPPRLPVNARRLTGSQPLEDFRQLEEDALRLASSLEKTALSLRVADCLGANRETLEALEMETQVVAERMRLIKAASLAGTPGRRVHEDEMDRLHASPSDLECSLQGEQTLLKAPDWSVLASGELLPPSGSPRMEASHAASPWQAAEVSRGESEASHISTAASPPPPADIQQEFDKTCRLQGGFDGEALAAAPEASCPIHGGNGQTVAAEPAAPLPPPTAAPLGEAAKAQPEPTATEQPVAPAKEAASPAALLVLEAARGTALAVKEEVAATAIPHAPPSPAVSPSAPSPPSREEAPLVSPLPLASTGLLPGDGEILLTPDFAERSRSSTPAPSPVQTGGCASPHGQQPSPAAPLRVALPSVQVPSLAAARPADPAELPWRRSQRERGDQQPQDLAACGAPQRETAALAPKAEVLTAALPETPGQEKVAEKGSVPSGSPKDEVKTPAHGTPAAAEPLRKASTPSPEPAPKPVATAQGASSGDGCPDANADVQSANRWMEANLGVDGAMLRRVHERFEHCRKRTSQNYVRRGDFVRSLHTCPTLLSSFAVEPICKPEAGQVMVPRLWGDVAMDLAAQESDLLTWANVLDVVRKNRDLSLGFTTPPPVTSGRKLLRPEPVKKTTEARERLQGMIAEPRDEVKSAAPKLPQKAGPVWLSRLQAAPSAATRASEAKHPKGHATAPSEEAPSSKPKQPPVQPSTTSSKAEPAWVARLYGEPSAKDSKPAQESPLRVSLPPSLAAPSVERRQVKVQVEVSRDDYQKWCAGGLSGGHVEAAVAKVLGVPGAAVRFKGQHDA